jgi:hypothetical protein
VSPVLAPFGHAEAVVTCPLLGDERTSLELVLRSVVDPSETSDEIYREVAPGLRHEFHFVTELKLK